MAERQAVMLALNPRPKPKEVPKLREFAEEFMAGYVASRNKPSERANKRSVLDMHLYPAFGDRRLDSIGLRDIDAFRARLLKDGRKAKTANNVVGVLRRILRYAVDTEVMKRAPRIEALKVMQQPFDFLTFEELDRLCVGAEAEPTVVAAILLGAHAGLRRGELIGLAWDDVDLKASTPQLKVRRASWRGELTSPKGGRERTVPLSERLVKALKTIRSLNPTVLTRETGEPWNWEVMRFALPRSCKRAGLRSIGWHSLRHTFCSHLAMRGAPAKAIQELAGHADLHTTLRYMHLAPATLVEAVRLLDEGSPAVAKTWRKAVSEAE